MNLTVSLQHCILAEVGGQRVFESNLEPGLRRPPQSFTGPKKRGRERAAFAYFSLDTFERLLQDILYILLLGKEPSLEHNHHKPQTAVYKCGEFGET